MITETNIYIALGLALVTFGFSIRLGVFLYYSKSF